MKKIFLYFAALVSLSFACSLGASAQIGNVTMLPPFPGAPSGACTFLQLTTDLASGGTLYNCYEGGWVSNSGGGGGGTVTSVGSGTGLTGGPITGAGTLNLAIPVTTANGGTGTVSTLSGILRGGNPFTGSELSGDATTSGSNAVTNTGLNGAAIPASAALVGTNSAKQLVANTGTIANNTSGNAATATQLAAAPTNCSTGYAPTGVTATGNANNCTSVVTIPQTLFNATTYGATFNTQYCTVAAITSGSTTVTCATANFVNAASPGGDVGKEEWVMGICTGVQTTGLAVPQGTITAVNSATSITVSIAATCNLAGGGSNGLLIWGTNDDTALNTGWTAASNACYDLSLPEGIAIVSTAKFNSYTGCVSTGAYIQPGVNGVHLSASTILIPDPNFSFTGCTPACFFGALYMYVSHISVWGTAYNPSGGASKVLSQDYGGFFTDMDFEAWCGTCASSTGLNMLGSAAQAQFGGVEAFGATNIKLNSKTQQLNNFVGFGSAVGVEVLSGANAISLASTWNGTTDSVLVDAGATFTSINDLLLGLQGGTNSPAGPIQVNGTLNLFASMISSQASNYSPILLGSTGILNASDNAFQNVNVTPSGGTGGVYAREIYNGSYLVETSGGVFNDLGGNTYPSAGAYTANPPVYKQTNSARGGTTVSSFAISFPISVAGDAVFALMTWDSSSFTSTGCTDTQLNTYTQIGSDQTTTGTYGTARKAALWATKNAASSGADTITCTTSGAVAQFLIAPTEFNNQNQTTLVDQFYASTGAGVAIWPTFSVAESTTVLNDQVAIFMAEDTTATYTPLIPGSMPMTSVAPVGIGSYAMAYGPIVPITQYPVIGNLSANTDWAMWVVQIRTGATNSNAAVVGFGTGANCPITNGLCSTISGTVVSGLVTSYDSIPTADLGLSPIVGKISCTQASCAGTATNLLASAANALYRADISIDCTASTSLATVNITIGYTDPSGTAQTITGGTAAVCTTLGTASILNIAQDFATQSGTAITYLTTTANTPSYQLRAVISRESTN
jgi:hypothetical protein